MTEHASHRMHENSLASYEQGKVILAGRANQVLECIRRLGICSDRQVMEQLGFTDPNKVRPRITELVEAKRLVECGKRKENGRSVRIVKVAPAQLNLL